MAMDIMEWVSVTSVLVVGAVSLLIFWIWRSQQVYKKFDQLGIPGPRPTFLTGHSGHLRKYGFCNGFTKWTKQYGGIYRIFMFKKPIVIITNPDMLRDLMVKKFAHFPNRVTQPVMDYKPWSETLLQLKDDHWKHIRSQLSPTFSSGKLKKMMPAISKVLQNLRKHIKEKAETGQEVELRDMSGCFAMDTIAGAAFGMDVDSMANPDGPFNTNGRRLLDQNMWLFFLAIFVPWMLPLLRYVGFSFIAQKPTNFFMKVMDMAFQDRRLDEKRHGDFLQMLVDAQTEGEASGPVDAEIDHSAHLTTSKQWSRKGMSDDEIKANAFLFLLGGFDTTATVLSFTLFHLAANPHVLLKAQKEVDEKLGQSPVTYEIANDLTYLDMCMNEAMRLFPPGFLIDRDTADQTEVGGYLVKKGTQVMIPVYSIHRDPEHWTDPETFDPERHTPEAKAARHPFVFMPFGMGPRNCIGMRLAQLEIRMALATILQRYTPVLCDKSVYPPKLALPETRMIAKDGLWVTFKARD